MAKINWKCAMYNVLPWIKEEMEKCDCERELISRSQVRCCNKSLIVTKSVLLDKMNIPFVDRKDVKIDSLKYSFRKHMIGKGYIVRLYGGDSIIILEENFDLKNSDSEYVIESGEGYISQDAYNKRMENEDNIRKMRHGKDKKTLSDYKEKVGEMLPFIKEKIDESEDGLCIMSMKSVRSYLGLGFEIYGEHAIFNNIRNAMESFNIIAGLKGHSEKKWTCQYITFRYKQDDEQFIWKREGFVSRKEYEECLKEDRKCNDIRKIVSECRNKDPNSLFNNKELVKKIFTKCDVG